MGAKEYMMSLIVRRRLLSNKVPADHPAPLEGWIELKARKTFMKNRELREDIGRSDLGTLTRADFEKYQLFRVREQMRYAMENVPFYRDRFNALGIRPEDIRTYDDLLKIPLTEPGDLAENSMLFYGVSATKMAREFTTTGTTGHRKSIGFTASDLISKIDIISSALKGVGMSKGDSLHIMFPLVTAWDPSLMMAGACSILGYGSSVCAETDTEKQLQVMRDSHATFIIGLPSFIYRVTALMKGEDLRSMGIKKIISTSEPLSESMRALLEEAWGCKVIDVWGMTEFGLACAIECDCQNGLHTDEANMIMEIIDPETGRHLPPGEKGELVITSLNAQGTVLIRYRTRDITAFIDPPCDCGAMFNRKILKPGGRMDLQFKIGMGHKVYPLLFDEAVFVDPRVLDYQVEISKDGYRDLLTFRVEASEPSEELASKLVDSVSKVMEVADGISEDLVSAPKVEFVEPGSMEYAVKAKKIRDLRGSFD